MDTDSQFTMSLIYSEEFLMPFYVQTNYRIQQKKVSDIHIHIGGFIFILFESPARSFEG